MRSLVCLLITLPLMAQAPAQPAPSGAAAPAAESWLTGTVDVGYRYITGVGGDFNTYRSLVDLGEGPKLFNADLTIQPGRFADRIDIHANSWGGDPYNTFRLDARRQGLYNFSFDYRNIAYFNFLPSYSNPGLVNPALPFLDQYGFDIFRRVANVDLELLPGHRIIPYVAYSRNGGRGRGTTNFVLDQDEYTVPTNYSDYTNEAHAGVRFEFNRWHATLEGGGLHFANSQDVSQGSQLPNPGNATNLFLGRQLFFGGGSQAYGIRGSAEFARGLFTANPVSGVDISASFLYSQPHTDIHFTQSDTGNLFNSDLVAFFNAELLSGTGTAKQPNPSANVSVTLRPFGDRLRILESWTTDRMHTTGSIFLLDQFLATGLPPSPLNIADATQFVANYNQQELNLLFDVASFLTLRAGHRYVWGDTTAPASISSLGQGLTVERGVLRQNSALAGAAIRIPAHIRLNIDFEDSPGDRTYFRTSLNDYKRGRVLARWQPASTLELSARFDVLKNENPDPSILYDFLSRDNTVSAYWNPIGWKNFSVLGEYSRTTVRSSITYLIPNQPNADFSGLASALSTYRENAHTGTLLTDVPFPGGANRPKLSVGGSFFRSAGTRPERFWEPLARLAIPFGPHVQFNTEWRWYALTQPYYLYEGFRSHQFNFLLRFSM